MSSSHFTLRNFKRPPAKSRIIAGFFVFTFFSAVLVIFSFYPVFDVKKLPFFHDSGKARSTSIVQIPSTSFETNVLADDALRPAWLSKSSSASPPLKMRVAIMTRPNGFLRRAAYRDAVLSGLHTADIELEYVFVVGYDGYPSSNTPTSSIDKRLMKERDEHKDILLLPMKDGPERMSEKRYRALQWAHHSSSNSTSLTYDWFMTIDDDTFVRFTALARRLNATPVSAGIHPRTEPVLIGRMSPVELYWNNVVSDVPASDEGIGHGAFVPDTTEPEEVLKQDTQIVGLWHDYPDGIGYLMSASLVSTLVLASPPIPHHVPYPYDTMLIGAWVSSLWSFHHDSNPHSFILKDFPMNRKIVPTPHTPNPIVPRVIDDVEGFHGLPGRGSGGHEAKIGWNSVVIHRLKPGEMRWLRTSSFMLEE